MRIIVLGILISFFSSFAFAAPVIIIDPGHGGKDPGAVSKKRIREKDIVLSISRRLAARLRTRLGAEVFLTRSNDRFIPLGQRDLIANQKSCDLFLSIHANASKNPELRGIEIYYLNKATDAAAARLARRENEGAPQAERETEAIVSDLIQTASTEESADVAKNLRGSLHRQLKKKYRLEEVGVKTALFYVLVGSKCPSLLIETGFLTNGEEGRRLRRAEFQSDLADAIVDGVARFFRQSAESGRDL